MAERIFVGVAWPYVNGPAHIGQIAGAYLPADVFARYHRLKGNQVLMVSGSDQHGTPITIRAEQEGVTPQELASRYHANYLDVWQKLGISWDCYTSTGTDNHRAVVHDIFTTLRDRGYITHDDAAAAVLRDGPALPPRPLRRRDVPDVRLRVGQGRPVRAVRRAARPAGARLTGDAASADSRRSCGSRSTSSCV